MEELRPVGEPAEFWLMTWWDSEAQFDTWHRSHTFKDAHKGMPPGLRIMAGYELDNILTATDTLMDLNTALITTQRELACANHQLTRSETTIRRLSLTDPLTGIANRRALDSHTQETFANGDANDTPVRLIIADIDHFKHVNDT